MHLPGLLVFLVTYVLISGRRLQVLGLDRPAAALLGAVACVAVGALTPDEALGSIDASTLLLLFGVMGMGAFLALGDTFTHLEAALVRRAGTPRRLLGLTVWGSGLAAAFITNDAVCVLAAPLLVRLVQRHELPPLPFVLALATAANTGSVATLVGNPQNMLCAALGGLSYRDHLLLVGPVALLGLAVNHALLAWWFRADLGGALLPAERAPAPLDWHAKATLGVIGLTAVAYTLGAHLAWTAAGGFVVLMFVHRKDTRELWPRIDWSLLLFFSGLFVVVEGLKRSGAPDAFFAAYPLARSLDGAAAWAQLSAVFLFGSNIVSNVPFILVVKPQLDGIGQAKLAWELLTVASTFAGNLTLLGSVANVIVAEQAREVGGLSFWAHLKVGLPLALLTTAVGTAWLLLVG